jgi:small subunit ribosomal protein S5
MAEKETINQPKDLIEPVPEEVKNLESSEVTEKLKELDKEEKKKEDKDELSSWSPRTNLGKSVKTGKIKELDKILSEGKKILESEIVDFLIKPESDLILIGQAKGKFGGGKRRAWRQTQKKTQEGNVLSFSAMAVAGDKNGHIGVGFGRARETLPAREKAVRNSKLSILKIERGFESPEAEKDKSDPHTVPFKIEGKVGSVVITMWPAPRGTGLVTGDECKKILKLAGIKDVYTKSIGKTKTTFNLAKACVKALSKTTQMEL